jgi:isoquinoline 1-oxidoreductase beta subunit
MTHDSYRPAGLYSLKAGLDANGKLSGIRFHSTSPSISARLFPSIVKDGIDPFAVEGIDNFPYAAENLKFSYVMHDTGVTPGYWRAVSHNLNAVALECFIDECANAAGKDPIDYRLSIVDMKEEKHKWSGLSAGVSVGPRIKTVLEQARQLSGWGKALPKGRGRGIAVMEGYNDVTLDRVVTVVDAGPLVHPDQALAQMQSTINFGQSAIMFGEITVNNNCIEQTNFDQYRVVRMNEAPKSIEVHWLKPAANQPPGGLGEPGTAVIAPAIANAIFAASGKRVRTFPLTPDNVRAA